MTDYPKIDPADAPKLPEGVEIPEGYERWYGGGKVPKGLKYLLAGRAGWFNSGWDQFGRVPLDMLMISHYIVPIRKAEPDHVADVSNMVRNPLVDMRSTLACQLADAEELAELQAKKVDRLRMKLELIDEIIKEHSDLLATRGTNWREAFKKMDIAAPTPEQQDAIQDDNLSRLRHEH